MMIQTTSDIQSFRPVQKWLHELNTKSDFGKIENVAKYGNNISLLCFYADEIFLAKKTIENLLIFFHENSFGVETKTAHTLALQPYINLLRRSRLIADENFDSILNKLDDLFKGKPFRISVAGREIEVNRDYLSKEGVSLLENCIVSERSKIALAQNDFSACENILRDHPFAGNSSVFAEMRVIQFLRRKEFESTSELCLDWIKKNRSEEINHIFYFWLMVLAKESGASEEAEDGFENLTKIVRSRKNPSKIQLAILEKIFKILVKDLDFIKANELGTAILNAYELNDDELAWSLFAFRNHSLDFFGEIDQQRLFQCWKETSYGSVYRAGLIHFPDFTDNFSQRQGVRSLREHTTRFCDFLSDGQRKFLSTLVRSAM